MFGITLPAFEIAGGMILLLIGLDMLEARRSPTQETTGDTEEAAAKEDAGILPLGIPMLAGPGAISVDGKRFSLESLDCLYIGRGSREVIFESFDAHKPAIFYLLSYPTHTAHPATLIPKDKASLMELGSEEGCNRRTVFKYIHLEGALSCQLVMGVTHLHPGNAWNTMPPHTHMRRSEVYMYFNLRPEARVFHLMGPPDETRHLILKNHDAIVSPGWSIHAGMGTEAYSFCWGMGGENQDYSDMDAAPLVELR